MLNISDEVKNLFLQDSTKKQLVIKVDSPDSKTISDFNYYTGNEYWYGYNAVINPDGFDLIFSLENNVDFQWLYLGNYVRASMYLKLSNITSDPGTLNLRCTVDRVSGATEYLETTINTADYLVRNKVNFYAYETKNETDPILKITLLEIHNTTQTQFAGYVERDNYQVELADTVDNLPTTFSTLYSKGVDITRYLPVPDITNEYLDFESFSMTESLCSQDNIKFGLCESAHCEFTTVGYDHDLKDRTIRPGIRVQGTPSLEDLLTVNWWKDNAAIVPKGQTFHDVKTVTGSTYWTSHYLFYTDINQYDYYFSKTPRVMIGYKLKINSLTTVSGSAPVYFKVGFRCVYADGTEQNKQGSIKHNYTETSDFAFFSLEILYDTQDHGKIVQVKRPYLLWHDADKNELTNSDSFTIDAELKEFMVYMYDDPTFTHYPTYDPDTCYVYDGTIDTFLTESYSDPIPLGVYHVTDLKLEHTQNLIKQKVTAYDNIVKLEQNAANWYTQYMFGISFDEYYSQTDRVQFARQIYATYFNFMDAVGIESRGTETQVASYTKNDMTVDTDYYTTWNPEEEGSPYEAQYRRLAFYKVNIPDVDASKMYVIYTTNKNNMTNEQMLASDTYVTNQYKAKVDELGRGITTGSILVEVLNSNNVAIRSYCLDSGDYFTLPSGADSFNIYIRAGLVNYYGDVSDISGHEMFGTMKVYSTDKTADLVNKAERLAYYNMGTGDIYPTDSSITGRDVIRSILELCGCFFRLDRYNGLPEFVYCTKGGLYPRNDLYPADDLYPRSGTDQILPNGRYMSVIQDNYSVKDFGCVQIVIDRRSNETKSVCEYQYPLNPKNQNAYVIKDNIFLCAEEATYDIDVLNNIFGPMYLQISNMGYVPNVTEALGMPWIECGDRIGILTFSSGFESFVFRRTLKGIQLLIDTYESTGDEYTEAVKEFGYELYN